MPFILKIFIYLTNHVMLKMRELFYFLRLDLIKLVFTPVLLM